MPKKRLVAILKVSPQNGDEFSLRAHPWEFIKELFCVFCKPLMRLIPPIWVPTVIRDSVCMEYFSLIKCPSVTRL